MSPPVTLVALVKSDHLDRTYDHPSIELAAHVVGRLTLSILADGPFAPGTCVVEWAVMSAASIAASKSPVM